MGILSNKYECRVWLCSIPTILFFILGGQVGLCMPTEVFVANVGVSGHLVEVPNNLICLFLKKQEGSEAQATLEQSVMESDGLLCEKTTTLPKEPT